MIGPGKYDDLCTYVRTESQGAVILIVIGGTKGTGFSVQADLLTVASLPKILRDTANLIEQDMKQSKA